MASPAEHNQAKHNSDEDNPPPYSPPQYTPSQHSPAEYSPAEYSPAEYSPAEYSPAEYSSEEDSPAQYSPAQYSPTSFFSRTNRVNRSAHRPKTTSNDADKERWIQTWINHGSSPENAELQVKLFSRPAPPKDEDRTQRRFGSPSPVHKDDSVENAEALLDREFAREKKMLAQYSTDQSRELEGARRQNLERYLSSFDEEDKIDRPRTQKGFPMPGCRDHFQND
ncbi:hypothetical protein B0J18DRAFT_466492 [Chaetomium sp. MPI-SDFR-AT-0129]|nr:hypothetical protein B0J18DRAFT_466492 [Chaetomium sp. MPI-SDFR-AT-0129]